MTGETSNMWDGTQLSNRGLSLVVLTTPPTSPGGPPRAVVAAADGARSACLLLPEQLGPFLQAHAGVHIVCCDAAELYGALQHPLSGPPDPQAIRLFQECVASYRLYDVALLDQLARLAEWGGRRPTRLTLGQLASHYVNLRIQDEAWLACALASAAGRAAPHDDPVLTAEALCRARAVTKVFGALCQRALALAGSGSMCRVWPKYGPLGVGLQVQGAIALASVEQHTPHLAAGAGRRVLGACEEVRAAAERALTADKEARRCFKSAPGRRIKFRADGLPDVRGKTLQVWLQTTLDSVAGLHRTASDVPRREDGRLADTPEDWGILTRCHKLLRAWADLVMTSQVGQVFRAGVPPVLAPRYEVLPHIRSVPDLASLRRLGGEGIFRPASGHAFVALRLADLELRALAVVCEARFGSSALGRVFREGLDPHTHMAAALAGLDSGAFAALQGRGSEEYQHWVEVARVLLFAAPRALGEETVRDIGKAEFGLDLSLARVKALHARMVNEVFPEIGAYLRDDTLETMAGNLGATAADLHHYLSAYFNAAPDPPRLRQWFRADRGLPRAVEERLWALLEECDSRQSFRAFREQRRFDRELYSALFARTVTTLTGRMRGRLLFGEAHRAGYLDLADDAAKSALYALVSAGIMVVAFAEDTVLLEFPIDSGLQDAARRAEELARVGVRNILSGTPVVCLSCLLEEW